MHIALIHNTYIPKGGMERYFADMVKGFTARGDTVTAITAKIDPDKKNLYAHDIIVIKQSHIPKPLRSYFFARSVQQILRQTTFDIAISTTRSWGQDITICGGTHRGFLAHMNKHNNPIDRIEVFVEQKTYRFSQHIIAHSTMLRDDLVHQYGIPDEHITVVHPPVDPTRFGRMTPEQAKHLKRQLGLSPEKISLLFPSTGHRRKGLHLLLQAFAVLPHSRFELVIAGSAVKTDIKNREYVKFLGYVDNMKALYNAVDFTVLPSLYEPFGMVVPESLMCGTPVLVSPHVGARDILSDTNSMVFTNFTSAGIAGTIKEATQKKFVVRRDLIEQHHLLLNQHIDTVRTLCESIKRKKQ